ncbi:MAG: hypothetical protein R3Y64_10400 [Peptostreptococcaceae bacterium]
MISTRLKEVGLKITDLSEYFKLSRPTIYKFIDYYDKEKYDLIDRNIVKLFDFIIENPFVGKNACINFILNDIAYINDDERNDEYIKNMNKIKSYISSNGKYTELIEYIINSRSIDNVLDYILEVYQTLDNGITSDTQKKVEPLFNLIKELEK